MQAKVWPMKRRPLSLTIIGWIFAVFCAIGFFYHLVKGLRFGEYRQTLSLDTSDLGDLALILGIQVLGILGGVFLLRGHNWARWALAAWMAFHVVISAWNSVREVVVHAIFLAVLSYFLFRRSASAYFRAGNANQSEPANQSPA
jgi:hypothetical protein